MREHQREKFCQEALIFFRKDARIRRITENYPSKSALARGHCLMIPRDSACRLGHLSHRSEMGSFFPADRVAPAPLHQT